MALPFMKRGASISASHGRLDTRRASGGLGHLTRVDGRSVRPSPVLRRGAEIGRAARGKRQVEERPKVGPTLQAQDDDGMLR